MNCSAYAHMLLRTNITHRTARNRQHIHVMRFDQWRPKTKGFLTLKKLDGDGQATGTAAGSDHAAYTCSGHIPFRSVPGAGRGADAARQVGHAIAAPRGARRVPVSGLISSSQLLLAALLVRVSWLMLPSLNMLSSTSWEDDSPLTIHRSRAARVQVMRVTHLQPRLRVMPVNGFRRAHCCCRAASRHV